MRKAIRILAGAVAVVSVLTLAYGYASSLTAASKTLGTSKAPVSKCDTNGVTTLPTLSSGNVTAVTVSGIAAACGNLTLKATVNNGTTSSNGSATVPAGGGSASVTLAASVAMKDTMQIDVVIG